MLRVPFHGDTCSTLEGSGELADWQSLQCIKHDKIYDEMNGYAKDPGAISAVPGRLIMFICTPMKACRGVLQHHPYHGNQFMK